MVLMRGVFKVIQCIDTIRANRFSIWNNFISAFFSKDRYRKLNAIQCTLFKDKEGLILLHIKLSSIFREGFVDAQTYKNYVSFECENTETFWRFST